MPHPLLKREKHECSLLSTESIPYTSGVFAVYLKENLPQDSAPLPDEFNRLGVLLYIGKTKYLKKSLREHHFGNSSSKDSTLRRAIGALLKNELNLTAFPRTPNRDDSISIKNFRFPSDGERHLGIWMEHCLEYKWIEEENRHVVAQNLIEDYTPPFNIKDNPNPSSSLKDAIDVCEEEARMNARP